MNSYNLHMPYSAILFVICFLFLSACGSNQPQPEPDTLSLNFLRSLSEEELIERDSDGDDLSDYDEMVVYNTNPLTPDTDEDGLSDYEEIFIQGTDPLNADSDGDGINDGTEVKEFGINPLTPDSDEDGLTDCQELVHTNRSECENPDFTGAFDGGYGTDPLNPDTDEDGLTDCREVLHSDSLECTSGDFTGPYNCGYGTDPLSPDTDGDGYSDGQEVDMDTNPLDPKDPPFISEEKLKTIYFGFDQSNITEESSQQLLKNINLLLGATSIKIRITAFTDHIGSDQYNLRLSLKRANEVADFYKQNGISMDRIEIKGLGKAPVQCAEDDMDSDTPGCVKNRRAETSPIHPHSMTPMY